MNDLKIFNNGNIDLPVREVNGQIEFDAEASAIGLGIVDTSKGTVKVRWARVNRYLSATSGAVRKGDYISEPDFYTLAIKANNPTAEKFQYWVTHEVLPTIRKHGAYMTDEVLEQALVNPDTIIKIVEKLKEEKEAKEIAEKRAEQLQPDADYCKNVLKNPTLISSTEIAKRYGWGAVTLHKKLHELGVMYKQGKQWILYAKYSRLGYADRVRYEKGAGLLKWTPKGERFIYNLLKDEGIVPIIERPTFEEQLELQEQVEYNGPYFTASKIAWDLRLPHNDIRLIGKIATEHRLKPVFVDSNKYCRVVMDEYGRQSYEYTQLGAEKIEQLLGLEGYI